MLATQGDVEALAGRPLTAEEVARLDGLLLQATALIESHCRQSWEPYDEVPAVVVSVCAQMVLNVLDAPEGAKHQESSQFSAGPFQQSVSFRAESASGSPWLTRQLKIMLRPFCVSTVCVSLSSERY